VFVAAGECTFMGLVAERRFVALVAAVQWSFMALVVAAERPSAAPVAAAADMAVGDMAVADIAPISGSRPI